MFERIDTEGLVKPYDLACIRSLSSDLARSTGKDPAVVERLRRLANQAMDALWHSVNGGYRGLAWIEIDADLDPLLSRDDYKALIAEIKAWARRPRKLRLQCHRNAVTDLLPRQAVRQVTIRRKAIVPKVGLEPAPSCEDRIVSPARLPSA